MGTDTYSPLGITNSGFVVTTASVPVLCPEPELRLGDTSQCVLSALMLGLGLGREVECGGTKGGLAGPRSPCLEAVPHGPAE